MIGGASIIDMMILVIDINKGIQAQTAEVRGQRPFNPDRTTVQPLPTPNPTHFLFKKKFSVWLSEKLSVLILFSCSTKSTVLKRTSEKRK